ncbi:hypothetical protein BP6252_01950 [Coleophoma cylindrospora]|uniref:Uncharacterized protein n=1 Tax=Coleophoma cylindrospora TaxID=1849047 RepID=A0A3D8SDF1_9HELO|nr:hypothetical protein BP6252_01950 [Coleophoma cylindrospora]
MSSDSLAAFRTTGLRSDLQKLANEHFQHDLTENDRALVAAAATKPSRHAMIGSLLGLGLGLALASRVRANRTKMFAAFRAMERPTQVKFADGRLVDIPDITPFLQPSAAVDGATYGFFAIAGLFLGGETGLLTGLSSARRTLATADPEARKRVESAWRGFRADVLRKELVELEAKEEKDGAGTPWFS